MVVNRVLSLVLLLTNVALAWNIHNCKIRQQCQRQIRSNTVSMSRSQQENDGHDNGMDDIRTRRTAALSRRAWGERALQTTTTVASTGIICLLHVILLDTPRPALALVKGVAPPPKQKPASNKPKCTNIEECQAAAERKEQEEREQAILNQTPSFLTPGGTRYRDIIVTGPANGKTVALGDEVELYYKVLKLGKRSYDGLSGEGTVVFSRGYGLEDDENSNALLSSTKSFTTVVGSSNNIAALNEALVGMTVGGTRRFSVVPQKGWRKPTASCDGGPGGSGVGGDLRTDYIVVPTAQLVAEEACMDSTKQPFPTTYAQQRRMAQRFDQSLIMEVQVVSADPSTIIGL